MKKYREESSWPWAGKLIAKVPHSYDCTAGVETNSFKENGL